MSVNLNLNIQHAVFLLHIINNKKRKKKGLAIEIRISIIDFICLLTYYLKIQLPVFSLQVINSTQILQ